MHKRLSTTVVTWPFLLALTTLLINDWWLKLAYPSVITGKLSDFAGIAVVALLLGAFFPRRMPAIALGISVVFLWWKSPLSSAFILFVNDWLPFKMARTVDYSDLIALCVLPLCHRVLTDSERYALPWRSAKHFLAAPILGISLLGIMGTSFLPYTQEYSVRPTDISTKLDWNAVTEAIRAVAGEHHFTCVDEAAPPDCSYFQNDRITMQYSFVEPNIVSFEIVGRGGELISFREKTPTERKMEALRNSLKSAFASRFPGLEYVEPLNQRYR